MINKAALLLFRETPEARELLFAKAIGKSYLVLPGGKQEANETIEEALIRELKEELKSGATGIKKLGEVSGYTPEGRPLHMHLYSARLTHDPEPSAEIERIVWLSKDKALKAGELMTPMTLNHIFPFLDQQKLW